MAVKVNNAPELPTLNCVGKVFLATKDGNLISYQKANMLDDDGNELPGTGKLVMALDFVADPVTTGPNLRRYVWFDSKQFDPHNDGSDFSEFAKRGFDAFILGGGSAPGVGLCAFLTQDEGTGWLQKLEQYYDQDTGLTDMEAIGREIASRIDGKTIGYQAIQETKATGEVDPETGKRIYAKVRNYVVGDRFFDPEGRVPKNGQNTF